MSKRLISTRIDAEIDNDAVKRSVVDLMTSSVFTNVEQAKKYQLAFFLALPPPMVKRGWKLPNRFSNRCCLASRRMPSTMIVCCGSIRMNSHDVVASISLRETTYYKTAKNALVGEIRIDATANGQNLNRPLTTNRPSRWESKSSINQAILVYIYIYIIYITKQQRMR